jgi:hypothetical protein
MHAYYGDILSRIPGAPLWFDEHAVPRYDPFTPASVANIYAEEAVLMRIECQGCGTPFDVAMTHASPGSFSKAPTPRYAHLLLSDLIEHRVIHFGDPPNAQCCDVGPTMNSVPQKILEYWVKPTARGEGLGCIIEGRRANVILDVACFKLRRDPALEIDVTPDWARRG